MRLARPSLIAGLSLLALSGLGLLLTTRWAVAFGLALGIGVVLVAAGLLIPRREPARRARAREGAIAPVDLTDVGDWTRVDASPVRPGGRASRRPSKARAPGGPVRGGTRPGAQSPPIQTLGELRELSAEGASRLEREYAALVEVAPEEAGPYRTLGLLYLSGRRYAEAAAALRRAHEREPRAAEPPYYLALALCRGRAARELEPAVLEEVERSLAQAVGAGPTLGSARLLWAWVKEDVYVRGGLDVPPPPVEALLDQGLAGGCPAEELRALLAHLPADESQVIGRIRAHLGDDAGAGASP